MIGSPHMSSGLALTLKVEKANQVDDDRWRALAGSVDAKTEIMWVSVNQAVLVKKSLNRECLCSSIEVW